MRGGALSRRGNLSLLDEMLIPSCNQCSIKSPSPCPLPKGGEEDVDKGFAGVAGKTLIKK